MEILSLWGSNTNKENYEILKKETQTKIIIYNPDYAGWNFQVDIINDVRKIEAIFLGTTDKSYINLELCSQKGIEVINIPRYASDSVAEYLVMYLFTLAKKISLQIKNNNSQDFSNEYLQIE